MKLVGFLSVLLAVSTLSCKPRSSGSSLAGGPADMLLGAQMCKETAESCKGNKCFERLAVVKNLENIPEIKIAARITGALMVEFMKAGFPEKGLSNDKVLEVLKKWGVDFENGTFVIVDQKAYDKARAGAVLEQAQEFMKSATEQDALSLLEQAKAAMYNSAPAIGTSGAEGQRSIDAAGYAASAEFLAAIAEQISKPGSRLRADLAPEFASLSVSYLSAALTYDKKGDTSGIAESYVDQILPKIESTIANLSQSGNAGLKQKVMDSMGELASAAVKLESFDKVLNLVSRFAGQQQSLEVFKGAVFKGLAESIGRLEVVRLIKAQGGNLSPEDQDILNRFNTTQEEALRTSVREAIASLDKLNLNENERVMIAGLGADLKFENVGKLLDSSRQVLADVAQKADLVRNESPEELLRRKRTEIKESKIK